MLLAAAQQDVAAVVWEASPAIAAAILGMHLPGAYRILDTKRVVWSPRSLRL